jgi:radial spoke head protein 4/6
MSNKRSSINQNSIGRKTQIANVLPSLRKDLQNAKLVLQQRSGVSGDTLYDHLSRIIAKVIDERPKDVIDYFEFFSEGIRVERSRVLEEEMRLEDAYMEPKRLEIAQQRLAVLIPQSQHTSVTNVKKSETNEASFEEEESIANGIDGVYEEDEMENDDVIYDEAVAVRDLCELQFYWNLFGIGFPREEVFSLSCALRQLLKKNANIATCRFWGKIFGLQSDYYIAECTLTQDALEKRIVSFFP